MTNLRQELHQLVDSLLDKELEHAKSALLYCKNPRQHRINIENAKRRLQERAQQKLREHAERTGHGLVSAVGSGAGMTQVDGSHHSSMVAFDDGKDATVHFYIYRGTPFQITETIEMSEDQERLIRCERITSHDGAEQVLTVELPISR